MFITYNHLNPHGYNALEGVGSQYQKIINLYAVIKKYNLKYIHIPILVGHNYDNDKDWDEKWDNFFNFKKVSDNDELNIDIDKLNNMEKYFINGNITLDIILKNNKPNALYLYFHSFYIFYKNPEYYFKDIQNDLINAYDENNNHRKLIYNKNKTSIAIHIRVYNDFDDEGEYEKYSESETSEKRYYFDANMYENLIKKLKKKYVNHDIHIFSQEKYFDIKFKKLRDIKDIQLHFNDIDVFDTFNHLCKADVFVTGLSFLSLVAGYYNKNTVIFLPFLYPPVLKSWIIYDNNKNEI
jgi:hypothetical protein